MRECPDCKVELVPLAFLGNLAPRWKCKKCGKRFQDKECAECHRPFEDGE